MQVRVDVGEEDVDDEVFDWEFYCLDLDIDLLKHLNLNISKSHKQKERQLK